MGSQRLAMAGAPVSKIPLGVPVFSGVHTSDSQNQGIDGVAGFLCTWLGFSPDHYPSSIHLNEVILVDEDTETMYAAIWTSEETLMPPSPRSLYQKPKSFSETWKS